MELDEQFTFGRYKNLTLKEVYQGAQLINGNTLKAYLSNRVDEINRLNPKANFTTDISDTLLRIKSISLNSTTFDLTDTLNGFFQESYEKYFIGYNKSLDDLNINLNEHRANPVMAGGQPEYIRWCIHNVKEFYVDPWYINQLQRLPVHRFKGITIVRKLEDIYEYSPIIEVQNFSFDEMSVERNRNNFDTVDRQVSNYYSDTDESDEDYYDPFESTCACGESPCMCSDPDPG